MSPTPIITPGFVLSSGLLFRDDFNRANSSSLGVAWDVLLGTTIDLSANQARINLPGANNSQRVGWAGRPTLDTGFVQIDVTDHGGDSQVPQLLAKWLEGSAGYTLLVQSFENKLHLFREDGTSVASIAQNWDAAETGYMQLYFADSVQQGFARNTFDSTTAILAATDATHLAGGYAGFGWGVGGSPLGDGHNDDFILCSDKLIAVAGMTAGYKAKVRNSLDAVIAQATESGGSATINASEYQEAVSAGTGATEKIPYDGWKDIIVTTGADVLVKTIPGPIYPGTSVIGA